MARYSKNLKRFVYLLAYLYLCASRSRYETYSYDFMEILLPDGGYDYDDRLSGE